MNNKEVEKDHNKVNEELKKIMEDHSCNIPKKYKVKAIGYLTLEEPFKKGDVPVGFINKLKTLWDDGMILASMGHHDCEFCKTDKLVTSSSEKILIDKINQIKYIFPEMIFHYIEEHNFKPDDDFILFVMRP